MVFEGIAVTLLLLLAFLMLAMLMEGNAGKESVSLGEIGYTYTGEDNTLYGFSTNEIYAIDSHGSLRWNFTVPGQWKICNRWEYLPHPNAGGIWLEGAGPIIASDKGVLFVFMKPEEIAITPSHLIAGNLTAISRNGKVLWSVPLESRMSITHDATIKNDNGWYADVSITAKNGRVYAFHDYNETVIDARTGDILWNVANVSDPGSVDTDGSLCVTLSDEPRIDDENARYYGQYIKDYRIPSGTIEAYAPNGALYWRKDPGQQHGLDTGEQALPLYQNGLVYIWVKDGVAALDHRGATKWTKTFEEGEFKFSDNAIGDLALYSTMPFDPEGNLYLQYVSRDQVFDRELFLIVIGPDGKEVSRTRINEYKYVVVKDGIGYATDYTPSPYGHNAPANVSSLETDTLHAFDLKSGKELWHYRFRIMDPIVVTLNRSNVRELMGYDPADNSPDGQLPEDPYYGIRQPAPIGGARVDVYPGKGMVYAKFESLNFDFPIMLDRSGYAYFGAIYAIDAAGRPAWYRPMPPRTLSSMWFTPGGLIYYRTGDGRLTVTREGAAAGFTLTAALYLFLRFICVGAIARARARMSQNENRNGIFNYIAQNPGSTVYEIARGLGMNMGTIRYHTFVLGLNHKVVSGRMDGKYIRYFTNSNSYDRDEQLIVSFLRRDAIGRVLRVIAANPGIPIAHIARELEMPDSVAFRYAKELVDKGIVEKADGGREYAYTVMESQRERVARAMERIAPAAP